MEGERGLDKDGDEGEWTTMRSRRMKVNKLASGHDNTTIKEFQIFFTNFSNGFGENAMRNIIEDGHVREIVILGKHNKSGQHFWFVTFRSVRDVVGVEEVIGWNLDWYLQIIGKHQTIQAEMIIRFVKKGMSLSKSSI
ncbi:hypothetical protein VNO78_05283 [Psophocarpus tetragonolobus]|uniref:Uncharacterized protein n=1 Tax=Psophocarpus tetragonolobus TaxID=3891 RepID=A0AAN9XQB7_PSOTE